MMRKRISVGVFFLMISCLSAVGCIAQETTGELSFTGQVTYIDLEGGFFGIITSDGEHYLPLDLPEEYKQDGLMVTGTGSIDPDVMTIQMWGQPLRIDSISLSDEKPQSGGYYNGDSFAASPEDELEMTTLLLISSDALSVALNTIDTEIADVAKELKGKNLQSTDLTPYLEKIVQSNSAIYEASLLDRSGKIVFAYPDLYQESVGLDVSGQPLAASLLKNPGAGMSEYMETVEGDHAFVIMYPVYSSSQSITGYLTVLIHPQILIEQSLGSIFKDISLGAVVIQPDGAVLGYTGAVNGMPQLQGEELTSVSDSAKNTLALYSAGCDRIVLWTGQDTEDGSPVCWTSVYLHHTPWRILISG